MKESDFVQPMQYKWVHSICGDAYFLQSGIYMLSMNGQVVAKMIQFILSV